MSRKAIWIFGHTAAAVLVLACGGDEPTGPGGMSLAAEGYLNRALNIMEFNSIKRYEIEWTSFRTQAFDDAGAAQTVALTHNAIRAALVRIGDNHSFFRPPEALASPSPAPPAARDPVADLLDTDLGYLEVPAFGGGGAEANQLATQYHRLIEGIDTLGTCGWIVDLRGNTGGNMWPMVAGVGPILGEGTIGYFVDPDAVVLSWFYQAGSSGIETSTIASATDPYVLQSPDPPVAVLYDDRTASSGEGTAISFRGRTDARSFGAPTRGLSTANQSYRLSDGAMIFLTTSTMADRTGQLYGEKVIPDEVVEGAITKDPLTDVPLRTAMAWLRAQPACVALVLSPPLAPST